MKHMWMMSTLVLLLGCGEGAGLFSGAGNQTGAEADLIEGTALASALSPNPPAERGIPASEPLAAALPQPVETPRLDPAASTGGHRALGSTIVSLGSPTEPGLWLKTPLVAQRVEGRVVNPANGKFLRLTLIPIAGPKTAGSRMSLDAMRQIDAPLTGLTEVMVTQSG